MPVLSVNLIWNDARVFGVPLLINVFCTLSSSVEEIIFWTDTENRAYIGNAMDEIDYGIKKNPPEIGLKQTALRQGKLFFTQMLYMQLKCN